MRKSLYAYQLRAVPKCEKYTVFHFILDVILFIWQLPMNILGMGCWLIYRPKEYGTVGRVTYYHFSSKKGSISLGRFIFLCDGHWGCYDTMNHEYGHFLQGCILGWLNILVTAIPSIVWAGAFAHWREINHISYYAFYTEKWADKLGKVKRQLS